MNWWTVISLAILLGIAAWMLVPGMIRDHREKRNGKGRY